MKKGWENIKSVILLPLILIAAWIMTHVMALLGIFATAAYPIWVIFFPKSAFCLACRSLDEGERCMFCNEKIHKNDVAPKNARSIILNTFVIFVLTLISLGVVYLENQVIDSTGLLNSFKTVSFVIPDKSQYRTNEIFPMKIQIIGINTAINVVQADITFDPDILEVVEVSTKDSFATIFVQKDINNNLGYIRLTGGIPSPGYSKTEGTFGTVYFKAKSAGLVTVTFLPTSLVLADDGRGTNVLKDFPSTSYVIKPESITSEEEVTQRMIFEKDVLGASTSTETNPNICRIDLLPSSLDSDVLGVSDNAKKKEIKQNKGAVKTSVAKVVVSLRNFNSYVISLYSKVVHSWFTK